MDDNPNNSNNSQQGIHLKRPSKTVKSSTGGSTSNITNSSSLEHLGCSNCVEDFVINNYDHPHSSTPNKFWLLECGHISCGACLGDSDRKEIDPSKSYRCPIKSCENSRSRTSMIHELSRSSIADPAIQEFFETPNSITKRLESILSFQNQQMRLRIKNLQHQVQLQRNLLLRSQSSLNELPILKQQVHDLQLQIHRSSNPTKRRTTQSNQNSDPAPSSLPPPPPAAVVPHEAITSDTREPIPVDLNKENQTLNSDDPLHSPIHHHHQLLQPNPQRSIDRSTKSMRFNPNYSDDLLRSNSRSINRELSKENLRHFNLSSQSRSTATSDQPGRILGPSTKPQSHHHQPPMYNNPLMVIPEDEDRGLENHPTFIRSSSSVVTRHQQPIKDLNHYRSIRTSSNQLPNNFHHPPQSIPRVHQKRTVQNPSRFIQPMPIPTPTRHYSSGIRTENNPSMFRNPPNHLSKSIPQPIHLTKFSGPLSNRSSNHSTGFVYHNEDRSSSKNVIVDNQSSSRIQPNSHHQHHLRVPPTSSSHLKRPLGESLNLNSNYPSHTPPSKKNAGLPHLISSSSTIATPSLNFNNPRFKIARGDHHQQQQLSPFKVN